MRTIGTYRSDDDDNYDSVGNDHIGWHRLMMEYGIQFVVNSILADNDWPFFIVERDFDHVFLAVKSQGNDDDDGRFKGKWNKIDREHETWHVTARQFRNGLDSVHLVRSIALRHLVMLIDGKHWPNWL